MKELYQLIKSLDTNEKKYFRRFGLKDDSKGKTSTETLFEIIDGLDEFDEDKIVNRLKREKLEKQVVYLKAYLYDLLLDTLLWYNKEKSRELKATFELSKIRLLEDRGLDEEALRLSEKLMKVALKEGTFAEKWNALGKSIHFASNEYLSSRKSDFNEVNSWMDQRANLAAQMQRYHEYDALLVQQLRLMRKSLNTRNGDDLKTLNTIFENELVQHVKFADSRDARFLFHTLRLHHFQILNQWDNFYKEAAEVINYVKQHDVASFPVMQVLWAYAQLMQACYFAKKWDELESLLAEIQALEVNNQTEKIARFTYYTQLAIALYDFKYNEELLKQTLREATANLREFKNRLRPDVRLSITITCVSALAEYGNYNAAVDLCEDFLTNYDAGIRLDALLMLYVYEFICHLETGNMLYVNNTIQNVYRYFLRHDYNSAFESKLMHTFKKVSEIQDYQGHRAEIQKLKIELTEAAGDVSNHQHLALLPIVQGFLDAKLANLKTHDYLARHKAANEGQ